MLQRKPAAAQQAIERGSDRPGERGEKESRRDSQGQCMRHQHPRVLEPSGAQGAREGGGNTAAHAAVGQVVHQHHERQDQCEARQRVGAKPADETGFGNGDRDLHCHEPGGGSGQAQQAAPDGRGQKRMGHEGLRRQRAHGIAVPLPSADGKPKVLGLALIHFESPSECRRCTEPWPK